MELTTRTHYLPALFLMILLLTGLPPMALAQPAQTQTQAPIQTKLAQEEQNPISTMMQLGFKYFSYTGAGINGDQKPSLLNMSISLPYRWNKDWNLITQANMPFTSWQYGANNYSGAGNLQMQMYFSPRNSSVIWGVGPAFQFPTAANPVFDNGQYGAGPAFAVVRKAGRWVNAMQGYHLWKVGGRDDNPAMNTTIVQLALNYNLKRGWAISLGSGVIVDWRIAQGEKSVVPLGLMISHTILPKRKGGNPLTWSIGASYNVVRPIGAPQTQYKFQLTYLFPLRTADSPKRPVKQVKGEGNHAGS